MKNNPSCIQAPEVRHPHILLGFPKYTLLIDFVFCCLVPEDSVTSHRQLQPDSSQMEHPLAFLQLSSMHQTSRFGPAERGIWQCTKRAVECFGFREKRADLRSTLRAVKGDMRAEWHMVSWMVLLWLTFDAPFFILLVHLGGIRYESYQLQPPEHFDKIVY